MSERMQPFIVDSIRLITEALQHSSSTGLENGPNACLLQSVSKAPVAHREYLLDVAAAEIVNGRIFIFPDPGYVSSADWCVLHFLTTDRARDLKIFRLKGRLHAALTPVDFVARAYEYVLQRPIDFNGTEIYPPLIENCQLTKRDVLKILSSSEEAQSLDVKLVIVPHPSSWLSSLNLNRADDSSFPSLLVSAG